MSVPGFRRFMRVGMMMLTLLMSGCAAGRTARLAASAPSAGAKIVPLPPSRVSERIEVERWELQGPFPETVGEVRHAARTPWEEVLQQVADQRPGLALLSDSMGCSARELGLFVLDKLGQPPEALRRFIMARCGASVMSLTMAYLAAEVPTSISEKQLFREWAKPLTQLLTDDLGTGNRSVGIWFGRVERRAVLMFVSGERMVHLDATSMRPDSEGRIRLNGELLVPAERLKAMQNLGRFAYSGCTIDAEIALPKFAIDCEPRVSNEPAWIALEVFPAGRVQSSPVLQMLAFPASNPSKTYVRRSREKAAVVTDATEASLELLRMLNAVRQKGRLAPVELAVEESGMATHLAPHYFAAMMGLAPETMADTVMLGLEAEWAAGSIVRDTHFTAVFVPEARDLAEVLDAALEMPTGRETLLNPDVRKVAIGPLLLPHHGVVAAVFSACELFDEERHNADAEKVIERLTRVLETRSHTSVQHLDGLAQPAARAANMILAGENGPVEALEYFVAEGARLSDGPVEGWVMRAASLEAIEFPPDLVARDGFRVAVAVARTHSSDPSTRYIILLVATHTTVRTARLTRSILPPL